LCNNSLTAWRPAVWIPGFLHSKNRKVKNGMDAIFDPRKGLEGRSSLLLAQPITGNGARQAELATRNPGKPGFLRRAAKNAPKKYTSMIVF
jgi:hypothetical protein